MVMTWKHLVGGAPAAALLCAGIVFVSPPPSWAQTPSSQDAGKGDCMAAKPAEPATPVEKGENSGTQNMGATGWSGGGLGGSHNDTTHKGPTAESKTAQPETARGVDPTKPGGSTSRPC